MSLFAIGLGLVSAGAAGAFGYAVYRGHQKMTRLLDMQTLLKESQSTHFHHLNVATEGVLSDVRTLQSTPNAKHEQFIRTSTHHSPFTSSCSPTKNKTPRPWTCRRHARFCGRSFNINPLRVVQLLALRSIMLACFDASWRCLIVNN